VIVVEKVLGMNESGKRDAQLDNPTLLEQLFAFSPDGILVLDAKGLILRANPQIESLFGYSCSELLGNPVEILIPERLRSAHPVHRSQYAGHPRVRAMGADLELHGRRKDGSEFSVDIMLSPLKMDRESLVLAVVRDITERKKAEQKLRQSEQQFRSIVNSVKDYAIFLLDPEGRVTTWNPGAETAKGYKAEEIIGRHFNCFYTEDDIARGKPAEALEIARSEGQYNDEGWRVRKDGSRFWADVVITAIKDSDGKPVGFSKVTRDLTERKKAEDAVMLEFSKLAMANPDIGNLLSTISASIQHTVKHDGISFDLYDRETNQLRVHLLNSEAKSNTSVDQTLVPVERSATGHSFRTRRPLLLGDLNDDRFAANTFNYLTVKGLKSACWVPLVSEERVLGTLMVASSEEAAFGPKDLDALRHIANQVAIGLENMAAVGRFKQLTEKLAQEKQRLEEEVRLLEEDFATDYRFEEIIGDDTGLKRVLKDVETVAPTDATVLILGETGTGKELIARAIHKLSPRRERRIIKLNCSAIPGGLLESELFGHEKGAFTGAISQKIGRLELADGGSLFLDEIGDLPLDLQPKILRALQEKEIERLGSSRTIPVDVRLIAATNRDLGKMVAEKEFRSDLYYRLKVFPISIPPLRERRQDIPLLVHYFVDKHARRLNRSITFIPPNVLEALTKAEWPGNIRELENFLERAVILSKGPALRVPLSELNAAMVDEKPAKGSSTLEDAEREHIIQALRETKGMIGGPDGAAERLGLKRTTLNFKLKKLKITRADYK
jgi:formate hydrogenlyase transcriptional activator